MKKIIIILLISAFWLSSFGQAGEWWRAVSTSGNTGLLTDLVFVHDFEETSNGSTTYETHSDGTAFNGTNSNTTANQTGKLDKCYRWTSSSSSYVLIGDRITGYTNKISIAGWIKLNTLPAASAALLSKRDGSSLNDFQFHITNSSGSYYLYAILWNTSTNQPYLDSQNLLSLSTGTWYHMALTYDGATGKLYWNGSLIKSWSTTGNVTDSNIDTRVGDDWFSHYVDGWFDQVCFWKRDLSSSEISTLYNSGAGKAYLTW